MPKYLDDTGLTRFYDNIADRPVRSFETVAAMQAATDLKAGMTCHTNGFHASGDGGAAYYTVSASGTANGMDVLELQGGLFATLVVTEPYVTPEQFGAWGDGTHDDTESIQGAIDSGYPVSMGNHVYLVSESLTVYGVTVTGGDAKGSHIEGTNRTKVVADNAMADSVFKFSNNVVNDTRSYGITIKGINVVANNNISKVIDCNNYDVSECVFEDITLSYGENGFYFDHNCYLTTFKNCRVYHVTGTGFKVSGGTNTSNVFEKCYVDTATIGFDLSGSYCSMVSCATDVVTDVAYKFSYARFNVVSCGSESGNAMSCFEFGNACRISVTSGFYYGNVEDDKSVHINFVGVESNVTFSNVWLNLRSYIYGATMTAGKLYEFPSSNPNDKTIVFCLDNCNIEKYALNCENTSYFYKVLRKDQLSDVHFRYGDMFPYLGTDSYGGKIDFESNAPKASGNAIYMGFDTKNSTIDGTAAATARNKANGDIVMTKDPATRGGVGWSVYDASSTWGNDKVALIPIVRSGHDEDVPTGLAADAYGSMFYNRSSNQMNFWNGMKFSERGTYRQFTKSYTVDSNGIFTTDLLVSKFALLSCYATDRTGWIFIPFYESGVWKIKVISSADLQTVGTGSFNAVLHAIQITD